MAMPAPPPLVPDTSRRDWTVDELALLPDDGNRYEIVDGELLVTPAPSKLHQRGVRELVRLFLPFLEQTDLELYFAPTAVQWGPRSEVEPDLLVVPVERDDAQRHIEGLQTLWLAIEVLSPSTARADRHVKRAAYLSNGVPDYWIVDLANRFVERWRPGDDAPEILVDTLRWQPTESVKPLVIDLPAYFGRVHG